MKKLYEVDYSYTDAYSQISEMEMRQQLESYFRSLPTNTPSSIALLVDFDIKMMEKGKRIDHGFGRYRIVKT